jgi:hypothetical protein
MTALDCTTSALMMVNFHVPAIQDGNAVLVKARRLTPTPRLFEDTNLVAKIAPNLRIDVAKLSSGR